jgi:hypothetical protein
MTTQETTPTATTPAAAKAPKSYSVRLVSGTEDMTLAAFRTKSGWRVEAVRSQPDGKTVLANGKTRARKYERGMSQEVATLDAAKAAIEVLAKTAVRSGWARPEKKAFGGFARKADAFSSIPKPGAAFKK